MIQNLPHTRVGGMNSDVVGKYFETLGSLIKEVSAAYCQVPKVAMSQGCVPTLQVETLNAYGHEILNIDETGFDLCNCNMCKDNASN